MQPLTFLELEKYALSGKSNYWKEGYKYRWQYMDYVIAQAIIIGGQKIIEAGASGMPLFKDSFLFDYPEYDLNNIPYKFKDKEFDTFIALQVWEHLEKQSDAFREVMRISKNAILSFPYKWTWGDKQHKGIDDKKISEWTCNIKPESVKIINHRIIMTWRFD